MASIVALVVKNDLPWLVFLRILPLQADVSRRGQESSPIIFEQQWGNRLLIPSELDLCIKTTNADRYHSARGNGEVQTLPVGLIGFDGRYKV